MARLIDANSILDDFLKRYTEMERDGKLVFCGLRNQTRFCGYDKHCTNRGCRTSF